MTRLTLCEGKSRARRQAANQAGIRWVDPGARAGWRYIASDSRPIVARPVARPTTNADSLHPRMECRRFEVERAGRTVGPVDPPGGGFECRHNGVTLDGGQRPGGPRRRRSRTGGIGIGKTLSRYDESGTVPMGRDRRLEVLIGRADHAHINVGRARAAEPLDLCVPQHAEQRGVCLQRQVAHLTEEDRAAMRDVESPGFGGKRAGLARGSPSRRAPCRCPFRRAAARSCRLAPRAAPARAAARAPGALTAVRGGGRPAPSSSHNE